MLEVALSYTSVLLRAIARSQYLCMFTLFVNSNLYLAI
nr:MAG TPA_asm: hypothetical protein [Caudoviricetes sp.]